MLFIIPESLEFSDKTMWVKRQTFTSTNDNDALQIHVTQSGYDEFQSTQSNVISRIQEYSIDDILLQVLDFR